MNLANPEQGADTMGIFSDLPSETPDAEAQQSGQTATPEEVAATNNDGQETQTAEAVSDTQTHSRRVKAKLGDREIELDVVTEDVDLDIIPKGLMMEGDYRKKTMEASETRKALDAEKGKLDAALTDLYDQIEFEAKHLESDEMKELKEIDPDAFERKRLDVEKKVSKFKAYKEERDSELLAQHQELARKEMDKLPEAIPEWLDDSVMQQEAQKISNMLKETYQFTDKEIQGISDSRAISILRKAALYDGIQSATLESNRKRTVPKSSKPSSTAQSKETEEPSIESIFYGN